MKAYCWLAALGLLLASGAALAQARPPSALPSVHVLPALAMPGLDRQRILRVYLPPGCP